MPNLDLIAANVSYANCEQNDVLLNLRGSTERPVQREAAHMLQFVFKSVVKTGDKNKNKKKENGKSKKRKHGKKQTIYRNSF